MGKKCTRMELEDNESHSEQDASSEAGAVGEQGDEMLQLMLQMKQKMDNMDVSIKQWIDSIDERIRRVETGGDSESVEAIQRRDNTGGSLAQAGAMDVITPASLRSDVRAMQRATQRIAQYGTDDYDDEGDAYPTRRSSGKKSGSLMTAADNVKTRIDWPHMHIKRVVAGSRVAVKYKDQKIAEFVLGFLNMLDARKGQWDKEVMLNI